MSSSISAFFSSFVSTVHADAPEEKQAPAEEEEVAAVEEEEEEPEDVQPEIRDECKESKCAALAKHFEHCNEKVHSGQGFKGEDCVEELPHDALRRRLLRTKTVLEAALDTLHAGGGVMTGNGWTIMNLLILFCGGICLGTDAPEWRVAPHGPPGPGQ